MLRREGYGELIVSSGLRIPSYRGQVLINGRPCEQLCFLEDQLGKRGCMISIQCMRACIKWQFRSYMF